MHGAQVHRPGRLDQGGHLFVQLVMGVVHHRLRVARIEHHRQPARPERAAHRARLDPRIRQPDHVAAAELEGHLAPAVAQRGAAPGHAPQGADEPDAHRIVVVEPELHRFGVVLAQFLQQRRLHGLPVLHRFPGDDTDLRDIRRQVVQPVAPGFGQAVADKDQKGEIRIGLPGDRRQGQRFEMAKPQLHAFWGIEIGLAVRCAVMHPFEPAERGIGKPANTNDAHDHPLRERTCRVMLSKQRDRNKAKRCFQGGIAWEQAVDKHSDSPYTRPIRSWGSPRQPISKLKWSRSRHFNSPRSSGNQPRRSPRNGNVAVFSLCGRVRRIEINRMGTALCRHMC